MATRILENISRHDNALRYYFPWWNCLRREGNSFQILLEKLPSYHIGQIGSLTQRVPRIVVNPLCPLQKLEVWSAFPEVQGWSGKQQISRNNFLKDSFFKRRGRKGRKNESQQKPAVSPPHVCMIVYVFKDKMIYNISGTCIVTPKKA